MNDEKLYSLAAMVEFIHTSTLRTTMSSMKAICAAADKTANNLFGNAAAVLVGASYIHAPSN